jgi:histone H3/H4
VASDAHLPRALVKRIVMLDEDQGRIAADALAAVAHAAEHFLATLAEKAYAEAVGSGRQTLTGQDVSAFPKVPTEPPAWSVCEPLADSPSERDWAFHHPELSL